MQIGPRNPRLGRAAFKTALPIFDGFYRRRGIHRASSPFAENRFREIRAKLDRGETVYLAGICASGTHNSGAALVEVTREGGPKLICNNEEERFSGEKHTTRFPGQSLDALAATMRRMGKAPQDIDAWISAWDNASLGATLLRTFVEELPSSVSMLRETQSSMFDLAELMEARRTPRRIASQLRMKTPPPVIATSHHDNHAWSSFCLSPFARSEKPVMIAVLDGVGDNGSISLFVCEGGRMRQVRCNESLFDSLGLFYAVISSTQGGWTWLSSEGRYMGAAAWGDYNRETNPYYKELRDILSLQPDGQVYLNRSLANWPRDIAKPYTRKLIEILGEPIAPEDMWNPDAVLRVEDIAHKENTQERVDKAAATQMVFEDALMHIIDHLIRETGSDQLVLAGGIALNAVGNMRVLDHFDEAYYQRNLGRVSRLHLWVPPTPNDAGVAMGAAFMAAYLCGVGPGEPLQHAFYCGSGPTRSDIRSTLDEASDIAWTCVGNVSSAAGRETVADLMAFMTARDGVITLFQGAAETGPRALGHRSILANPCNPQTRDVLNARVKHREAIRPLAPMMTKEAALRWFELSDGASDDDYNAYNYMVLIAQAKPEAYERIPSVIHADGTGRLQIVRDHVDPLTYAYLKALGRHIGVEVAVNTSFNVAGPIAQTPAHALETLRRSKGIDVVLMVAEDGVVFAIWRAAPPGPNAPRFRTWFNEWRGDVSGPLEGSLQRSDANS